jgi:hypothetical protein
LSDRADIDLASGCQRQCGLTLLLVLRHVVRLMLIKLRFEAVLDAGNDEGRAIIVVLSWQSA